MTPKEYAKELVDKFKPKVGYFFLAKECALIVVDEILKELSPLDIHPLGTHVNPKIEYWQDVKTEIKNYDKPKRN